MQIFDSHCHYNLDPFHQDWKTYWQKAQAEGVTHSTVVSVDIPTSKVALELATKEEHLLPIIGCHPGYYQEMIEELTSKTTSGDITQQLLQSIEVEKKELLSLVNDHVVAIGETGLDYFRLPENETAELIKKMQQTAFRTHIEIAKETNLPLVIHARDTASTAYEDILSILKSSQFHLPFILHCVSGPSEYVQEAIKLGAYIGIAGNVTYKNSEHIRELAAFAPPDRILLETDAPFLPPIPFRGKPCEPWMIRKTAEFLESELSLNLEQVYQNTFDVFIPD